MPPKVAKLANLTAGQVIGVEYAEEEGLFHHRLLLHKTTTKTLAAVMGKDFAADLVAGCDAWWVLTPTGDIYVEQVAALPQARAAAELFT